MSDMTIRELAEKLGVSKTTISNLINSCGLSGKLRKTGTSFVLTKQQIAKIEKQMSKTDDRKLESKFAIEKNPQSALQSQTNERSQNPESKFAIEKNPQSALQSQTNERSQSSESKFAVEKNPQSTLQSQTNEWSQSAQKQLAAKDNQIAVLQSQISELLQNSQKQLSAKDTQIAILQSQMSELTESLQQTTSALNAAQALHAKTMQQKLLLESEIENKKSIKKWWMFGKNKKNTCECSG